MTDQDDIWISAAEAVQLLNPWMGEFDAQMTICARANDKLITARALRLVVEDYNRRPAKIAERDNVAVPSKFWWARGAQALTQNWITGDFETWIEQVHYKAYGVKFLRPDFMSMVPPAAPKSAADTPATQVKKGKKIFIGHGHSNAWRDLKDFIVERLKLPHDEFNAEPSAGVANVARLKKMLDEAAFAFLVLTAEDERADGQMQARMNVVHEAGLFQGHLGFEKAIILLEEGCSRTYGLGQIRFPPGSISAKFEEVRRVLEREGIIQP